MRTVFSKFFGPIQAYFCPKTYALLLLLSLVSIHAFAQTPEPPILFKNGKINFNMSKDTVLLDSLIAISKRHGVEKNFDWGIDSSKLGSKEPIRIAFGLNLAQFEEMAKQTAFSEKRAAVFRQFFADFQNCGNGSEYLALKREYLKKYPEHLKNEPGFQEEYLNMSDKEANDMVLNTEKYRQTHKN
jgi:hypothetical protein